jgi:hypothetical protein
MNLNIGIFFCKSFDMGHQIILADSVTGADSYLSLFQGLHFLQHPFTSLDKIISLLYVIVQNLTFPGKLNPFGVSEKKLAFKFFLQKLNRLAYC